MVAEGQLGESWGTTGGQLGNNRRIIIILFVAVWALFWELFVGCSGDA